MFVGVALINRALTLAGCAGAIVVVVALLVKLDGAYEARSSAPVEVVVPLNEPSPPAEDCAESVHAEMARRVVENLKEPGSYRVRDGFRTTAWGNDPPADSYVIGPNRQPELAPVAKPGSMLTFLYYYAAAPAHPKWDGSAAAIWRESDCAILAFSPPASKGTGNEWDVVKR